MPIIAISRQIGSLGNDLADELSRELKHKLLTREIIKDVLIKSGFSEKVIDKYNEKKSSILYQFELDKEKYSHIIKKVVFEFARKDNVIIMGMGGQFFFDNIPNAICVRVISSLETRIKRIMDKDSCDEYEAKYIITNSDDARISFHKFFFNIDIRNVNLYDLIINTDVISLRKSVDIVKEAIYDFSAEENKNISMYRINNQLLLHNIAGKILYEKKIDIKSFDVEISDDGFVTLKGFVEDEKNIELCEKAAKQVDGVKGLNRSKIFLNKNIK
jgi:cytidylate kinase